MEKSTNKKVKVSDVVSRVSACSFIIALLYSVFIKKLLEIMVESLFFPLSMLELVLWGIFVVSMFVLAISVNSENQREKLIELQEKTIKEENEKTIKFYKKCKEKGVLTLDSKEDTDNLMLIARMNDITDTEKAKELFFRGKTLFEQQKATETESKFKQTREREAKINKENKEKAETSPTDKYLYGIKTIHAACAFNSALSISGMAGASDTMRYRAQRSDSAIWGGIADGLAGPGAGIATAMDIEAQNARSEAEAAQSRANARDSYDYHQKVLLDSRGKQYSLERRIEYVKGLVYDEQNINEKFQMLSISTPSYKIYAPKSGNSTSKSVVVTFRIESVKPVTLFKKKAILDGSLRIVLKNSSGNTIGEGFYCAPGFDESRLTSGRIDSIQYEIKKLEKVGFVDCVNQDIRVSCYIYDSYFEQLSSDDNLKIEIEPVKMWIIEGKLKG